MKKTTLDQTMNTINGKIKDLEDRISELDGVIDVDETVRVEFEKGIFFSGSILTPNEYEICAMRTANVNVDNLLNGALGLAGEVGEVVDMIKKHKFHGHYLDKNEVVKELGDIIWYCTLLSSVLGVKLESVMRLNIEKLKNRYPDGFSEEASRNRVE